MKKSGCFSSPEMIVRLMRRRRGRCKCVEANVNGGVANWNIVNLVYLSFKMSNEYSSFSLRDVWNLINGIKSLTALLICNQINSTLTTSALIVVSTIQMHFNPPGKEMKFILKTYRRRLQFALFNYKQLENILQIIFSF